jgi:uncharacterized phage protein (TIGR02220 family)
MSFWTDSKVVDDYTPEDRYFMLYAMTNNYTNIIGCYEISIKQMSNDLGYTKDVVENLLKRFQDIHKTIEYDFETKELLIKNWSKYNWNSSPKLDNPLYTAIENVKSDKFHDILATIYNNRDSIIDNEDMVSIPYRYGMDTTITITNTNTITNSITNSNNNTNTNKDDSLQFISEEIISRLNELTGSSFRSDGKATKDLIKNLLKEYTKEDILMVVEKMCYKWVNDKKMSEYLRPSTLFRRSNFENYYGMKVQSRELTTDDLDVDTVGFLKE